MTSRGAAALLAWSEPWVYYKGGIGKESRKKEKETPGEKEGPDYLRAKIKVRGRYRVQRAWNFTFSCCRSNGVLGKGPSWLQLSTKEDLHGSGTGRPAGEGPTIIALNVARGNLCRPRPYYVYFVLKLCFA